MSPTTESWDTNSKILGQSLRGLKKLSFKTRAHKNNLLDTGYSENEILQMFSLRLVNNILKKAIISYYHQRKVKITLSSVLIKSVRQYWKRIFLRYLQFRGFV